MMFGANQRVSGGHDAPAGTAAVAAVGRAQRLLRSLPRGLIVFVTGFVAGAVFWHAVGFWSFVSTVVLRGPVEAGAGSGAITTGSISPAPITHRRQAAAGVDLRCTALELDRRTGLTRVGLCTPRDIRWIKPDQHGRADRLAAKTKGPRPVP